jgi:hypothetical protein
VLSARRRRRYAQSNRHSSVQVISRQTSSQSSSNAVYSARHRALRTSTPSLRTVEPPFVCAGYQSSDVNSVIIERRVLRTSPCSPHVDDAVTHSRSAIRLWRLSVVGRGVSRLQTPITPHVDAVATHSRTATRVCKLLIVRRQLSCQRTPCTSQVNAAVTHSQTAIRLWRLSVVERQVSYQRTLCAPLVSVYSARRRRRYSQSNQRSSLEVTSRRTCSQFPADSVYSARFLVLRTSTPPLRTAEPPLACGVYQSSDVKSVINEGLVLRTSPCSPHVDAAVMHSRTDIRLWRLSVVGCQVSRLRTARTTLLDAASTQSRTEIGLWR